MTDRSDLTPRRRRTRPIAAVGVAAATIAAGSAIGAMSAPALAPVATPSTIAAATSTTSPSTSTTSSISTTLSTTTVPVATAPDIFADPMMLANALQRRMAATTDKAALLALIQRSIDLDGQLATKVIATFGPDPSMATFEARKPGFLADPEVIRIIDQLMQP